MRGALTEEIQENARRFLGREINQVELRLYPYIDYCIKNGGRFDPNKINEEERIIIRKLKDAKLLDTENWNFYISKEFYNYIQTILWLSYVETKIGE